MTSSALWDFKNKSNPKKTHAVGKKEMFFSYSHAGIRK
jgi:hypothetical protein